mgnify:CR=1 FL=1
MSMDLLVRLPDPDEIKKKYPASEKVKQIKAQRDKEIADVFTGKSDRFLLIIGPCSAGGVLHSHRNIKSACGKSVLLILDRARTDSNI